MGFQSLKLYFVQLKNGNESSNKESTDMEIGEKKTLTLQNNWGKDLQKNITHEKNQFT